MTAWSWAGVLVVLAGAVAVCPTPASAGAPRTFERPAYARQLEKLVADNHSGAVGIVVTRAGTWKGAAGWADFDARRRADPDDRFAIESTTKTFVATVVLQLVAEGRLALYDTVQRLLPGTFTGLGPITIEQLLRGSSGLPSNYSFTEPPTVRVREIVDQGFLMFEPGSSVILSANSDYVVLGLIVERATGRRLDEVVTDRIIRRLHLRSTSYGTLRAPRITPWLGPEEFFGRPVSGDGGIISTVEDLATFFRALLAGKLLPPEQLSEMTRTSAADPDFGLGIFRYGFVCGSAWGHGGDLTYSVNVAVARDGTKAVITAQNAPTSFAVTQRLYCT